MRKEHVRIAKCRIFFWFCVGVCEMSTTQCLKFCCGSLFHVRDSCWVKLHLHRSKYLEAWKNLLCIVSSELFVVLCVTNSKRAKTSFFDRFLHFCLFLRKSKVCGVGLMKTHKSILGYMSLSKEHGTECFVSVFRSAVLLFWNINATQVLKSCINSLFRMKVDSSALLKLHLTKYLCACKNLFSVEFIQVLVVFCMAYSKEENNSVFNRFVHCWLFLTESKVSSSNLKKTDQST